MITERLDIAQMLFAKHRYALEAKDITLHDLYTWIYSQNVLWPHVKDIMTEDLLDAIEKDWHPQDYRYFTDGHNQPI